MLLKHEAALFVQPVLHELFLLYDYYKEDGRLGGRAGMTLLSHQSTRIKQKRKMENEEKGRK